MDFGTCPWVVYNSHGSWAVGNLQRRDKGRHPRESAGPECPGAPLLQRHSAPAGLKWSWRVGDLPKPYGGVLKYLKWVVYIPNHPILDEVEYWNLWFFFGCTSLGNLNMNEKYIKIPDNDRIGWPGWLGGTPMTWESPISTIKYPYCV